MALAGILFQARRLQELGTRERYLDAHGIAWHSHSFLRIQLAGHRPMLVMLANQ